MDNRYPPQSAKYGCRNKQLKLLRIFYWRRRLQKLDEVVRLVLAQVSKKHYRACLIQAVATQHGEIKAGYKTASSVNDVI